MVKQLRQVTITERRCAGRNEKEVEECEVEPLKEVTRAFEEAGIIFKFLKRSTKAR
jgi:hypothetical protein